MDNEAWEKCSSTANAVECRNEKYKQKQPIHLRWQCLTQFDKAVCANHFAAESIYSPQGTEVRQQGVVVSFPSTLLKE